MQIGLFTDSLLKMNLQEVLDFCTEHQVTDVEIGTGNYSPAPHCNLNDMLANPQARKAWTDEFSSRGIAIRALNCSGNMLHPNRESADAQHRVFYDTIRLAGELGIDTVVCMSGCPGAPGGSSHPHWSAGAWLPDFANVYDWQMNEMLVPYWHKAAEFAQAHGVRKICLELHPGMTVFNPYTFFDLQQQVGETVYANLDPSHLFWQGMDPMAVIELLGDRIGFVHAKDTILDSRNIGRNGVLDPRWPTASRSMPWYFCTMGYGHDYGFWKAFMLKLREHGYNGVLSIEHEDPIMAPKEAVVKTVEFMREVYIAE